MSIRAISWAFDQTCGSPTAKLILIKLADNANDHGSCWPSIDYMADHCELSRTAIKENIDKLVALGLVEVTPRYRNNLQQSNNYQLKIPNNIRRSPSGPCRSPSDPLGGRQVTTEPSVEPKITPTAKPADKPVDNSTLDSNLRRKGETAVDMVDRWKREFETVKPDPTKH